MGSQRIKTRLEQRHWRGVAGTQSEAGRSHLVLSARSHKDVSVTEVFKEEDGGQVALTSARLVAMFQRRRRRIV